MQIQNVSKYEQVIDTSSYVVTPSTSLLWLLSWQESLLLFVSGLL